MPRIVAASTPEQIEIDATRRSIADVAAYLQEHIGQRPTAYLSGLKDVKTVGQWAAGEVTPRSSSSLRIRHAYQAVRLIVEAFGDETAKAWLFGINSQLDGEAPAFVLRHSELPEEITPIVRAARGFAELGHGPERIERTESLRKRVQSLERSQVNLERKIGELIEQLKPAMLGNSGKAAS
ncbi:MAG TPA: hypothetical protein VMR44_01495 [Thermoanaerobaculia bacterium]|nr:hypothetical protein [Thermoanaerobaculia bacterium]